MRTLSPSKQQGVGLVEVLVTLLVVSIGLLGMAVLPLTSIKSNQSAYLRSQATFLAYDISERMRANRFHALEGDYDVDFPGETEAETDTSTRAGADQAEWFDRLAKTLPDGTGQISRTGNLVKIEIRWDDTRGAIGSAASEDPTIFVYETQI